MIAVVDVARLEAEEIAPLAVDLAAELEVVAAAEAIEEVRQRTRDLRLQRRPVVIVVRRARALLGVEVGAADGYPVDRRRLGLCRIEREVIAPVRDLQVEKRAAAQCARPLDLLRTILRILPVGRGHRDGERQIAQRLELRPAVVEADNLVRLAQLIRDLDGPVEELALCFFAGKTEDRLVLIVVAITEEVPEPPLPDRPACVGIEVVLLRDRVAARQSETLAGRRIDDRRRLEPARINAAGCSERIGNVVRQRPVAEVVVVDLRRELVAARLDREIQERPHAGLLAHVARAAQLEFLEAPEIEIAGVSVCALGHVDAFQQRLVLVADAVGLIAGLRARVRSADIVRGHLKPRRLRHRRPDVAGVRDVLEELPGEIRADGGALDVHRRRFAGDRHRLLQRRQRQLRIDAQCLVEAEPNLFTSERLEPCQLEGDRVEARRQCRISVGAVGGCDGGLRLNQRGSGDGHRHARQHGAGVVGDEAGDASAQLLRVNGRDRAHAKRYDECQENESIVHAILRSSVRPGSVKEK